MTEPIGVKMGPYEETIRFIVALGMDHPMILGLAWLVKWNPTIDWERKVLKSTGKTQSRKLQGKWN